LPALQTHGAIEPKHQARDRRADHGGDGDRDGKGRKKARAIFRRIPIGQIKNDAGEKAGFGDAEQKAQHIKARLAAHGCHQRRNDAPGHHDARDPAAGAEFLQRQIARHLEDEIADEEDSGAPCEDQRGEFQFGVHRQRGEAEIDAVKIRKEIGQHQERYQPPRDRADSRGFDLAFRRRDGERGGLAHGFAYSWGSLCPTLSHYRHVLQHSMPALA
jgi:hypothetical protein